MTHKISNFKNKKYGMKSLHEKNPFMTKFRHGKLDQTKYFTKPLHD